MKILFQKVKIISLVLESQLNFWFSHFMSADVTIVSSCQINVNLFVSLQKDLDGEFRQSNHHTW